MADYVTKKVSRLFPFACVLAFCVSCSPIQTPTAVVENAAAAASQTTASTLTPEPIQPEVSQDSMTPQPAEPLTNVIGDLLSDPDQYAGKQVEIVGYFRGWDLLGEASGSSAKTRSDWVITDAGGAMYVTGQLPENLDPSSKENVWVEIRLSATFMFDRGKAYLKAEEIEIIQ